MDDRRIFGACRREQQCFRPRGFTYLGVLIAIFILGLSLATVGQVARTAAIRDKESELLFAGDQIRLAIAAYYDARTGADFRYPRRLQDLLEDPSSSAGLHRKLRQLYVDPFSEEANWDLVRAPDGGVRGVFSRHEGAPLKRSQFPPFYAAFASASAYSDWKFVHVPGSEIGSNAGQPLAPDPTTPISSSSAPAATTETSPVSRKGRLNCNQLDLSDQAECSRQTVKWKEAAECQETAQMRKAACLAGDTLPPLYIRY